MYSFKNDKGIDIFYDSNRETWYFIDGKTNKEKEYVPHVRDLIGKNVRMSFYNRDNVSRSLVHIADDKRGRYDVDHVVEGKLQLVKECSIASPAPACWVGETIAYLFGIVDEKNNVINYNVPLLSPFDLLINEGNEKGFDGKHNGEYKIEPIPSDNDQDQ